MRALILLLALLNAAHADELKIATWNLNWFTLRPTGDPALPANVHRRDPASFHRLRDYAAALKADIIALEEVDGPDMAGWLFPGYAVHFTADDVVQRVGFAIRPGLSARAMPDLTALDVAPPGHHHLRSGADIALDTPAGPLRLLAIHLKTGCQRATIARSSSQPCHELRDQIPALQGWIAARARDGSPFLILGDFNRVFDRPEEMFDALNRITPLSLATAGHNDPCWGGSSFIDHILAGGTARGWLQPDTLRVMVYKETDPAMAEQLSDHCAVSVRIRLP